MFSCIYIYEKQINTLSIFIDLPTYDEAVGREFANLKGGNTYKPNYIIYNN